MDYNEYKKAGFDPDQKMVDRVVVDVKCLFAKKQMRTLREIHDAISFFCSPRNCSTATNCSCAIDFDCTENLDEYDCHSCLMLSAIYDEISEGFALQSKKIDNDNNIDVDDDEAVIDINHQIYDNITYKAKGLDKEYSLREIVDYAEYQNCE